MDTIMAGPNTARPKDQRCGNSTKLTQNFSTNAVVWINNYEAVFGPEQICVLRFIHVVRARGWRRRRDVQEGLLPEESRRLPEKHVAQHFGCTGDIQDVGWQELTKDLKQDVEGNFSYKPELAALSLRFRFAEPHYSQIIHALDCNAPGFIDRFRGLSFLNSLPGSLCFRYIDMRRVVVRILFDFMSSRTAQHDGRNQEIGDRRVL
jgi:hypothetical protein